MAPNRRQWLRSPLRQKWHVPHAITGSTATAWPTARSRTPSPMDSTCPAISCPGTSGSVACTWWPVTMCTSVPQTPADVTRMSTSPGPGCRSGTSRTSTVPGSVTTAAFIVGHPFRARSLDGAERQAPGQLPLRDPAQDENGEDREGGSRRHLRPEHALGGLERRNEDGEGDGFCRGQV